MPHTLPLHIASAPDYLPVPGLAIWRDKLSQLLESTGEGIFGIDMQGRCTFINRAGAEQLGWPRTEVLGRNMHQLAHHTHGDGAQCGQHYPEHLCPIFNAFRQGLPCRIDTEYFWRQNGTPFAVEYSSYPIMEGDVVQGAVITFVDISARRGAEDALKQAHAVLELRVSERTHELQEALTQLRELSAYTHSVREDERTRIAREVHDELGSLLVALKMDVGWLDKRLADLGSATESAEQQQRGVDAAQTRRDTMREKMRHKCQSMSRQIETAVDNVGRIVTDLRPSILDHQGLWAALDWQAREFVQSAELELDWQMDVVQAVPLSDQAAIGIFRIFQEMLSNVGRHAKASSVAITIQAGLEAINVTVQDNGCGADPAAFEAANAYGVMGMRERARHLGGSIVISSKKSLGSAFQLCIPLPKQYQRHTE